LSFWHTSWCVQCLMSACFQPGHNVFCAIPLTNRTTGGPLMSITNKSLTALVESLFRDSLWHKFIWQKPLSHSAEVTGKILSNLTSSYCSYRRSHIRQSADSPFVYNTWTSLGCVHLTSCTKSSIWFHRLPGTMTCTRINWSLMPAGRVRTDPQFIENYWYWGCKLKPPTHDNSHPDSSSSTPVNLKRHCINMQARSPRIHRSPPSYG
jgi:hypothetical protein